MYAHNSNPRPNLGNNSQLFTRHDDQILRQNIQQHQNDFVHELFVNFIFPYIICPLMIIIGISIITFPYIICPILICIYIPYLIYNYPVILLLIPLYALCTIRIYGRQSSKKLKTKNSQLTRLLRSLFLYLIYLPDHVQRIHIDRNFIKFTIYTDATEDNLRLIYTNRKSMMISLIQNVNFVMIKDIKQKLDQIFNELIILERVLHARYNSYLPLKRLFRDLFNTVYITKKRYLFKYIYEQLRTYKTYGHNFSKRFHSLDTLFNVNQFAMNILKMDNFMNNVEHNVLCVAKCFDHAHPRYFLEEKVQDYCIETDNVVLYQNFIPHFQNSRDKNVMLKNCCRKNKPCMAKLLVQDKQIDFDEEYQEYESVFIKCCEKGMIDICVIMSDSYENFKINGVETVNDKIIIKYTILPKLDPKSVTMISKRMGINNLINRSDIGKIIDTRGDDFCLVCRSDDYNLIIRCGHTYCISCVDEWYFQNKHEKKCLGCTLSFSKHDMYVIRC